MDNGESCCLNSSEDISRQEYWDSTFNRNDISNWVETTEPWIMPWIDKGGLDKDAVIFCAGVGDSNIVEAFLARGYKNIIANDISEFALEKLKKKQTNTEVTYLVDDLVNPSKIQAYHGQIDVYIDRATLHFFTACVEKDHYFDQLSKLLKPGALAILGVFSKENTARCCGLDLQLWSLQSLQNRLFDYEHLDSSEVSFEEVNGSVRNYIYQFSRKKL